MLVVWLALVQPDYGGCAYGVTSPVSVVPSLFYVEAKLERGAELEVARAAGGIAASSGRGEVVFIQACGDLF